MRSLKIVPVPEKMQKFYGTGSMLHPNIGMIEERIAQIPVGNVTTIGILAEKLAKDFGADVTCPMRTGNHLKRLSKIGSDLPFWRVIKTDAKMIKLQHYEHWARILEKEGLELEFIKSEQIKVNVRPDQLFSFD